MDKLGQVKLILCLVATGNIQYQKTLRLNSNKIRFSKICNQMKIMQGLYLERFLNCFKKLKGLIRQTDLHFLIFIARFYKSTIKKYMTYCK